MEHTIDNLLKIPGNNCCADCRDAIVEKRNVYVCTIDSIVICQLCSGVHRHLAHKVKTISADKFDAEQLADVFQHGNAENHMALEVSVPIYYCNMRQMAAAPGVRSEYLRIDYILNKYDNKFKAVESRRELERSPDMCSTVFQKRGKENSRFNERQFILNEAEDTLTYSKVNSTAAFASSDKDNQKTSDPSQTVTKTNTASSKASAHAKRMQLSTLNATFIPDPNADSRSGRELLMLSSYSKEVAQWHHIYVRASDRDHMYNEIRKIVCWYYAIRFFKYSQRVHLGAHSGLLVDGNQLSEQLTMDVRHCGWLYKTGPKRSEPWKWRYCRMLGRHIIYMESCLDAYGKGQIFIKDRTDLCNARAGMPVNTRALPSETFAFTVLADSREYVFAAESKAAADLWVERINELVAIPLSTYDLKTYGFQ